MCVCVYVGVCRYSFMYVYLVQWSRDPQVIKRLVRNKVGIFKFITQTM